MSKSIVLLMLCALAHAATNALPSSLPFGFEPNWGQSDSQVRYLGRASDAAVWFTDTSIVLTARRATVRFTFAGASRHPEIAGVGPTGGHSSYFSADSSRWRSGIPQFERVRYSSVYPGIDLVFYGSGQALEYDWIVQPNANPDAIQMTVDGASSIDIAPEGDLVLKVGPEEIRAHRPRVYQAGREMEGHFVRRGRYFGFAIAPYDHGQPLTIDPVLTYSTYIGGSSLSAGTQNGQVTFEDNAYGAATDSQGNVVLVGGTYSGNFPVQNGYSTVANTGWSGIVMKVNPKAATPSQFIVWSTYLGGNTAAQGQSEANATAVAIDKQGNVYVTGFEAGPFPTVTPFQPNQGGGTCALGSSCHDAFVSKLSPDGTKLMYSSYLGGSGEDYGFAITVDANGYAYVGGQTQSNTFPANRGYQGSISGSSAGFITVVMPSGTQMLVSSFFGGDRDTSINAIAADNSGNVYVAGCTSGTKFPTMNAYQSAPGSAGVSGQLVGCTSFASYGTLPTISESQVLYDGFVAEFNASTSGLHLLYSTYLGGTGGSTQMNAIALDGQGDVIVAGYSQSASYPITSNAFEAKTSSGDAVITKLKPSNTGKAQLIYSTALGGSYFDQATALAIDSAGRFVVAGTTYSYDFPTTTDGFEPYYVGIFSTSFVTTKSFVSVLDPTQKNQLVYSTYLGGLGTDEVTALALDSTGIDIVGLTYSQDMYTTANAYQQVINKSSKIFLARIDMSQTGPVILSMNNAASFALAQSFVPGMMVTYFGNNIGPAQLQYSTLDNTGHLGNTIAGCQVIVNGVAAPMIYASANQTSAILPYEITPNIANQNIVYSRIVCNGTPSNTFYSAAAAAAPGIFATGNGTQGAILNSDGSYNSAANPAKPGDIITFFATGEGTLNPAGQDGLIQNGSVNTLPTPTQQVQVMFGTGSSALPAASIPFAGVAPQSVDGLLQVNAQIPLNAPAGNVQLTLQVGGISSQANLTVAIGPAASIKSEAHPRTGRLGRR